MRENKHKGKELTTGEWVYGNLLIREGEASSEKQYFIVHPKKNVYRYEENKVYPETICEFSGKNDKDGRDIFEGDIVKDNYGNVGKIYYDDDILAWRVDYIYAGKTYLGNEFVKEDVFLEVIGNLHDNPGLLKAK